VRFKTKLNLYIIPSILISVVFVLSTNFIVSRNRISSMEYEYLNNNVQNILEKCESKFAVIKALGMEDVEYFQDATKQQVLEEIKETTSSRNAILILDTQTNKILFTTEMETNGLTEDQSIIKKIIDDKSGKIEYALKTDSGNRFKKMAAVGVFDKWNWLVISNSDKQQVFSYLYNAMKITSLVISLFLFFIFISIYKLSKGIGNTIEILSEGTQRISENDFNVEIEISENNEFRMLAQNFNTMANEIKKNQDDLKTAIELSNRANVELDQSLKWNEALIASIPDLLFTFDDRGFFLDCMDNGNNLLLPRDTFIGKNIADLMSSDVVNKTMNAISKTLKDGSIQTFDYDIDMSGGHLWYESRNIRLTENTILSIARDITERREAEEALKESEERLRITLNSIGDAVMAIDISGKITQMNTIAEKLTGWSIEEAENRSLPEVLYLVDSDTRLKVDNPKTQILATEDRVELSKNIILIDRDKKEYQIAISGSPILSVNREIVGVVLVFRDISKEYAIQEKLNHRSKMDAIGQLAGGVAHDFNNMLGGILNAAQLLKSPQRNLDEKGREYIDLIIQASTRAADLTAKLLTFGRKEKVITVPVDINSVIDETVSILKGTIDKKITITVEKNAENHIAVGNGSELQNAFLNLGINASQAMPDGGEIQITTNNIMLNDSFCNANSFDIEPGEYYQIEVRDTGNGISLNNLQKIFEPFYTTKEPGKGTGLGLSSVYGTVQDHHGAITVYSKIGKGTAFNILLPCSKMEIRTESKENEVISGLGVILLVDDEDLIRITGSDILENMGYKTILAENGQEAVDIFQKQHSEIDLVIMDVIMPEMNGREAFFKMKEIDKNCKVIFSSGFTRDENINDLIKSGLLGFIRKPYRDYELSRLLTDVLSIKK